MRAPGSGEEVSLLKFGKASIKKVWKSQTISAAQNNCFKKFSWYILDCHTCKWISLMISQCNILIYNNPGKYFINQLKRMTLGWLLENSLISNASSFHLSVNNMNISELTRPRHLLPLALPLPWHFMRKWPQLFFSAFSVVTMASAIWFLGKKKLPT